MGGICDVPANYIIGVVLPWVISAFVVHLQILLYMVNGAGLVLALFVGIVCPQFMWVWTVKEAHTFEKNYRQSLQMIV
jgi:hypothetical protein